MDDPQYSYRGAPWWQWLLHPGAAAFGEVAGYTAAGALQTPGQYIKLPDGSVAFQAPDGSLTPAWAPAVEGLGYGVGQVTQAPARAVGLGDDQTSGERVLAVLRFGAATLILIGVIVGGVWVTRAFVRVLVEGVPVLREINRLR